jgi:predicted patatin/cPLA2 family phospholipase
MVDPGPQAEFDQLTRFDEFASRGDEIRKQARQHGLANRNPNAPPFREKNVLALSGGGSFGAFSAGVICGWTARGDRPEFDVVTGISTGALIAPFAFLGSKYDDDLKAFYTTLESRDLYRMKPVRGLFGESLADNSRLAEHVDRVISPELMAELGREHAKGRRLYVGTTAVESKQFVVWDIGEIAMRGGECDRELIKKILLGSAAIPGAFPPQHIQVNVDGQCVTERHADGGVSRAIFIQPPYVPPEHRSKTPNADMAGTNLYLVVAGKLYSDMEPVKPLALQMVGKEISAIIYAQTRGDLQRIYTASVMAGMNYHLAAIPPEYPAPTSSMEFKIPALTGMFNEGFRLATSNEPWRRTPPGTGPGEGGNLRAGTNLTHQVRGPVSVSAKSPTPRFPIPLADSGLPPVPPMK